MFRLTVEKRVSIISIKYTNISPSFEIREEYISFEISIESPDKKCALKWITDVKNLSLLRASTERMVNENARVSPKIE